jgi:hypothetical protein
VSEDSLESLEFLEEVERGGGGSAALDSGGGGRRGGGRRGGEEVSCCEEGAPLDLLRRLLLRVWRDIDDREIMIFRGLSPSIELSCF